MTAKVDDAELPTIAEFVISQSKDAFCDHKKQLNTTPNCLFTFDKNGLLAR